MAGFNPPGPKQPDDAGVNGTAMRGARTSPVAAWVVQKASAVVNGVRNALGGAPASSATSVVPYGQQAPMPVTVMRREPWFGPGQPQAPMAPKADVAGRAFDYQSGYNMGGKPRQYSGVSFEQLRGFADSLDIARLCIETRKDQMVRLSFSILPKQAPGQAMRGKADDRCRQVEQFLLRPDRRHTWDAWLRMLLEDMLVIDAASIYVRRTMGGEPYALEIVDGSLIKPLLDTTGRAPETPAAAYQQILKGMPAVDYTTDELIYAPRNPRSNHVFGLSVIEQIIMTVNIGIRREIVKLSYFSEGNVPDALVSVPKEWQSDQIAQFQTMWDALLKNSAAKAGIKFIPGDMQFQSTRSDGMLAGPLDEWLARVVCFAFSLPPTAFVQQQNRATAETAKDTALEEGLGPTLIWSKSILDRIAQDVFGFDDLEAVWDDVKQIEVAQERAMDIADVNVGIMSRDEVRGRRGLDPCGIGLTVSGGPNGIVFLDDLLKAKAAGLTAIQAPPAAPQLDEFGQPIPPAPPPAAPGAPLQLAAPAPAPAAPKAGTPGQRQFTPPTSSLARANPLAGIPADILARVGLGPQGSAGRSHDVTAAEETQTDPEMANVPHRQVLDTLRAAEAMHKRTPHHHQRTR